MAKEFFIKKVILENCTLKCLDILIAKLDMTGVSSQLENWAKTIEERQAIISELVPPRILKGYEVALKVKDSPLIQYYDTLNETTGFHLFVAKVVGVLLRIYRALKQI